MDWEESFWKFCQNLRTFCPSCRYFMCKIVICYIGNFRRPSESYSLPPILSLSTYCVPQDWVTWSSGILSVTLVESGWARAELGSGYLRAREERKDPFLEVFTPNPTSQNKKYNHNILIMVFVCLPIFSSHYNRAQTSFALKLQKKESIRKIQYETFVSM